MLNSTKQHTRGVFFWRKEQGLSNLECKVGGQILLIETDALRANPNQPREVFDAAELDSLAKSIRLNGIIQPIAVRINSNGEYEVISGERRLRAAKTVGMNSIPCILMDATDEKSALFALIENMQRSNLGFFEEAAAIERLESVYCLSRDEISKKLGKSPAAVSNKLRLLRLSADTRQDITCAGLTERHARALLRLETDEQIRKALSTIIKNKLNVAQSEKLIESMLSKRKSKKRSPVKLFKDIRLFVNTLNHAVETMRHSGIDADAVKTETENYIEYTVRIPKNRDCVITNSRDSA